MKVNKRSIATILRESDFSPTTDSLMKIIVDVDSFSYYVSRSLEEIHRADQSLETDEITNHLTMAISLLALAKTKLR